MKMYRYQSDILMKLFHETTPVSADILCRDAKMSVNSLRKTIEQINMICADQGMQIVSKTGSGFLIEVTDRQKYEEFSRSVTARYYRNQFFRDSSSDVVHYILRRLLSRPSTTLREVADELYVSVSTINRYMPGVKKRLDLYDLRLENHTNIGLVVNGSEWKYRLALVNEYQIYHDFKAENEYVPEDAFERLFLSGGAYRKAMLAAVRHTLARQQYFLSFDNTREFTDLLILSVTRKKYSDRLEADKGAFADKPYEREADILAEIYRQLPTSYVVPLTDTERLCLCAYLSASRIIYPGDLNETVFAGSSQELTSRFIHQIEMTYHMDLTKTDESNVMDFVCNVAMLMRRASAGIHRNVREVRSIRSDGLLNLDICMDFYEFMHQYTSIDCTPEDAMGFYYNISGMTQGCFHAHKTRKVLLVSRYGYYYAKNISARINKIAKIEDIEFVPVEYLQLERMELDPYTGIATDIDEIRQIYQNVPVYMVHYLRKSQAVFDLVQRIVCSREEFSEKYFRRQDLRYVDLESMADVYRYVSDLYTESSDEQKREYAERLRQQHRLFTPVRQRSMLLIRERHSVMKSFLFTIIVPNETLTVLANEKIQYIVVINVPDNQIDLLHFIYNKVAELLHAEDIVLNHDSEHDYQLLLQVMYRHQHLL